MRSPLALHLMELDNKEKGELLIEAYLLELLARDPKNIDLWFRLAVNETSGLLGDYARVFNYVDEILKLDPHNYKALLFCAEVHDMYDGIPKELLDRLNSYVSESAEVNSMMQYMIFKYYRMKGNTEKKIQALERSVQLYQGHVYNNFRLGEYYLELGRKKEALLLFERARKNIVNIYETSQEHDFTDVDEYIAEFITGTCTTRDHDIEQAILKCKEAL